MKPRIKRVRCTIAGIGAYFFTWQCSGDGRVVIGPTIEEAFARWRQPPPRDFVMSWVKDCLDGIDAAWSGDRP